MYALAAKKPLKVMFTFLVALNLVMALVVYRKDGLKRWDEYVEQWMRERKQILAFLQIIYTNLSSTVFHGCLFNKDDGSSYDSLALKESV